MLVMMLMVSNTLNELIVMMIAEKQLRRDHRERDL